MAFISPTRGDVHVNRPLTNISIAFLQKSSAFVADSVFPNIPVVKQADRYFVYDRGEFNRDEMQKRGLSQESAGGNYDIDNTPNYFADVWSFHKDIDDQIRANADVPIDMDRDATNYLTHKALIRRERAWASSFFALGIWATDRVGVAAAPTGLQFLQWNDPASTPIETIRAEATRIGESTGFRPNKLVLSRRAFDALVDHPDVVGRLDRGQTPVGPALVNRAQMAALFEVDQVLVMDGIYNTAAKGAANVSSFIGDKDALLVYAAPNPGILVPSGGYTFSWTGYLGASANGIRIMSFRMDHLKSDRVEIEQAFDQKLISADLGTFFSQAVA